MKSLVLFSALVALPVAAHAAALPGDAAAGQKLHDAVCMSCHNDSVYTRQDRHITSLDGLKKQVDTCGHMSNVTLGKEQVANLVKFLNEKYYKFK